MFVDKLQCRSHAEHKIYSMYDGSAEAFAQSVKAYRCPSGIMQAAEVAQDNRACKWHSFCQGGLHEVCTAVAYP
jgi:hypothetical protein